MRTQCFMMTTFVRVAQKDAEKLGICQDKAGCRIKRHNTTRKIIIMENLKEQKLVTSREVGEAIFAVVEEVLRQEELWDRWAERWDDPNDTKLRVLAEEFGEIAIALNDKDYDNLPVELAQTAAVCVSWLASLIYQSSSSS